MSSLPSAAILANALEGIDHAQAQELFINPETGKPTAPQTIAKWRANPESTPLWAARLIAPKPAVAAPVSDTDFDSDFTQNWRTADPGFGDINPLWSQLPEWSKPGLCIGFPTSGHSTHTKTLFCLMALQARHGKKVTIIPCENNPVGRARDIIATQFMTRPDKPDWLLFIDNDMIVPFGNEAWALKIWAGVGGAPHIAGNMDICSRLVSHGKPLIGGLYVGKSPTGYAQFAEAYENPSINRIAHAGPRNEIKPTKWSATGCLLINRSVFTAIMEKFPELAPRHADDPWRFFAMEDDEGEDMLFCKRARAAGITCFVDLGCHCGHEGNFVFWPHNTTAVPPKQGAMLDAKSLIAAKAQQRNPQFIQTNGHVDHTPKVNSPDVVQRQRQQVSAPTGKIQGVGMNMADDSIPQPPAPKVASKTPPPTAIEAALSATLCDPPTPFDAPSDDFAPPVTPAAGKAAP